MYNLLKGDIPMLIEKLKMYFFEEIFPYADNYTDNKSVHDLYFVRWFDSLSNFEVLDTIEHVKANNSL